jgi:hypothetical protein
MSHRVRRLVALKEIASRNRVDCLFSAVDIASDGSRYIGKVAFGKNNCLFSLIYYLSFFHDYLAILFRTSVGLFFLHLASIGAHY